jgi:hypothetical protein
MSKHNPVANRGFKRFLSLVPSLNPCFGRGGGPLIAFHIPDTMSDALNNGLRAGLLLLLGAILFSGLSVTIIYYLVLVVAAAFRYA